MQYTIPFHVVGAEAPESLLKIIRALGVEVPGKVGWLDSEMVGNYIPTVPVDCCIDDETCEHYPHGLG